MALSPCYNSIVVINGYDIAYGIGVGISAPFWMIKPSARRKVLGAFSQRMGHVGSRDLSRPAVLIHAVSVGELNATPALVEELARTNPDLQFIISTTTEGGYDRARQLYGSRADVTIIRYPLDFSSAIGRVLDGLRPSVIVLMELEVWPNFLRQARRRQIPVIVVNGRLSQHSRKRYRLIRPMAASMFRQLSAICVQDEDQAAAFKELGAPPDRVHVTGTMKFDTVPLADHVEPDGELLGELGLTTSEPVWVCGSTGPGEEAIVLETYQELRSTFPDLRLIIVPRKLDRFDEVARLIKARNFTYTRRSRHERAQPHSIILGDTLGELRRFYTLAAVVFVGRTLVDLGSKQHGSDMIEPAALGKAVIVGPYTGNFADAMNAFRNANAMIEIRMANELKDQVARLLRNREEASSLGTRARDVVRQKQGATKRHAELTAQYLNQRVSA